LSKASYTDFFIGIVPFFKFFFAACCPLSPGRLIFGGDDDDDDDEPEGGGRSFAFLTLPHISRALATNPSLSPSILGSIQMINVPQFLLFCLSDMAAPVKAPANSSTINARLEPVHM
jgi:hypothetical protein